MLGYTLVLESITLLIASRRLARLRREDRLPALVAKTASQVGLPLRSAYEAHVRARLLRRERSAILGQAFIVMAAIPLFFLAETSSDSALPSALPLSVFIPIAIATLSRPLAVSAMMAWEVFARRHSTGPRVARLVTPVLGDYVSPYTFWTARLMAAVVVPTAAVLTWFAQDVRVGHVSLSTSEVVAVIAVELAGLAVLEVVARRLVNLPQPVATPIQLAWDDALRAQQLDQLYTVVTLLSLVVTTFVLAVLKGGGVAWWTLLAGLVLFNLGGDPAARYRKRLWSAPSDRPLDPSVA